MEELRNASIDSGAEAMSALDEQMTEIKSVLRNTSQLDAVTQKQQVQRHWISIITQCVLFEMKKCLNNKVQSKLVYRHRISIAFLLHAFSGEKNMYLARVLPHSVGAVR